MIQDIRMFLVGNKIYEFEINQQYLEFKALFRGYVIMD